jgi:hypothetical protein
MTVRRQRGRWLARPARSAIRRANGRALPRYNGLGAPNGFASAADARPDDHESGSTLRGLEATCLVLRREGCGRVAGVVQFALLR